MRKRLAPWLPSPAMSVAALALFVALAGTGYAAFAVPPNSVGTTQLKDSAVTAPKLAIGSVTGTKVAQHGLTGRDINLSTLGMVPSANEANSASELDSLTFARLHYTDQPGEPATAEEICPMGNAAISGGVENSDDEADVVQSAPYSTTTGFGPGGQPNAWYFETFNHDTSGEDTVVVWTVCAPARIVSGF